MTFTRQKPQLEGFLIRRSHPYIVTLAIQASQIGKRKDASQLLKMYQFSQTGWHLDHSLPQTKCFKLITACVIFQHYFNETRKVDGDLKLASKHLIQLKRDFPILFNEKGYSSSYRSDFLNALVITSNTPPPKLGSLEHLLVKLGNNISRSNDQFKKTEDEILKLGLSSIPKLVKFTKDPRLTKLPGSGTFRAHSRIPRLGELAQELLTKLTNESYQSHHEWLNWLHKQNFSKPETYLKSLIIKNDSELNLTALRMLISKHPTAAESLIDSLKEHPDFLQAKPLLLKLPIRKASKP